MRIGKTFYLSRPRMAGSQAAGPSGFSLLELLVTVAIFAIITTGLLLVFDSSSRLARSQTQLSVLQQSHRVGQAEIVRFARSAGRGGLPITRLNLPDDIPAPNGNGTPDWMEPVDAASYDNPGVFPEDGYAISVLNNAPEVSIAAIHRAYRNVPGQGAPPDCVSDTSSPGYAALNDDEKNCVLPGSDVLIVRGVFSTPVYYGIEVDTAALAASVDGKVTLTVPGKVQKKGDIDWDYPQDLETLEQILEAAKNRATGSPQTAGEAFILRDLNNPNAYFVMEFDHAAVTLADIEREKCSIHDPLVVVDEDRVPLCLDVPLKLESAANDPYGAMASGSTLHGSVGTSRGNARLPSAAGSLGVLEEYRFFVRLKWQPRPGSLPDRLVPVLSRARFLPGNVQVGSVVDIADNVIDLQIAVGVDTDDLVTGGTLHGQVLGDGFDADDAAMPVPLPGPDDEILFNHPDDSGAGGLYDDPPNFDAWFDPDIDFYFLRINTLVESAEPEFDYEAPELVMIEDFNRGDPFALPGSPEPAVNYNSVERRSFRRRWLQTIVELRNLR